MQISKGGARVEERRLCQLDRIPFPFLLPLPSLIPPLPPCGFFKSKEIRVAQLYSRNELFVIAVTGFLSQFPSSPISFPLPCFSHAPSSRASRLISLGVINLSWSNEFGRFECLPKCEKRKQQERKLTYDLPKL